MSKIIIFGNTINLAPVIAETSWFNSYEPIIVEYSDETGFDFDKVGSTLRYIISFRSYELRKHLVAYLGGSMMYPVMIIHPDSSVSRDTKIGAGTYIAANVSIEPGATIGKHCIINLNASIGHNSVIDDHCVIGPGARISGYVKIGEGSFVGANSFVRQNTIIGKECSIEAMTHVYEDMSDQHYAANAIKTKSIPKKIF